MAIMTTKALSATAPVNRNRLYWTCLALLIAVMTIPRLLINYGMDGDAIRGMIAAQRLVETGTYIPSRLPGNPLFEYLLAVLSLLDGHILTNAVILAFYLAAIAGFRTLARDREHGLLLVGLFSLTPILVMNSVVTKDYIPSLATILWSYAAAQRKRNLAAYLLLSVAVGLRLPNFLFAIPLGLFLWLGGERSLKIGALTLLTVLVGAMWYVPVFSRSGWQMLAFPASTYHGLGYLLYMGYRIIMVFGPVATVGIVFMIALNTRNIISLTAGQFRSADPSYIFESTAVILSLALFVKHAHQSEYLIPAIPFFYLLLARWLSHRQLQVAAALILSFAVVSVELKGGESGRRAMTLRPQWGIIVKDYLDRKELEALRYGVTGFGVSGRAVIVHGYGPMLGFENPGLESIGYRELSPRLNGNAIADPDSVHRIRSGNVYLVSGLSRENVLELQHDGYRLFCFTESAPSLALHSYGYDPFQLGMERLETTGPNAFFRK